MCNPSATVLNMYEACLVGHKLNIFLLIINISHEMYK